MVDIYNSSDYTWDGHDSGQNNDFGGSIDMLTSARRLSYIYNSAPSTNQYHVSWGAVTSWFSWLTTGVYADLDSGSYLPVDIDMDTIEMVDVTGKMTQVIRITRHILKNLFLKPVLVI